jgi:hypothetical protein
MHFDQIATGDEAMIGRLIAGCLFSILGLAFAADGLAEVLTAEADTAPEAAADGDIAKWIEQLDADQFSLRSEASRKLESAGKAAFPALTEAALGDSREATLRALDILRNHFGQGDEATKAAAKESLQKIADSNHAAASRRAKEILNPPAQPAIPGGPLIPGIQIVPQQIQIRINAIGGNQTRRVRIDNGRKQIEVTDNDRRVKIVEDPTGSIEMEVTEKKDGKETTEKYSAKNAEDLKKMHPEAFKVYDKYANQQGGGIQIQAVQVQPGANPPLPVPPVQPPGNLWRKQAAAQVQHARRLLEIAGKQLQRLKAQGAGDEELDKTIKRLDDIREQLQEEETKLSQGG